MKKLVLVSFLTLSSLAQVKITKLNYKTENDFGVVTVNLDNELKSTPELLIKDDIVQIELPKTVVWPKIENKVTVNNSLDTTLMAYQYTKDLVRVRAALPYKLAGKENKVSIVLGDKSVSLYFPKINQVSTSSTTNRISEVAKTASNKTNTNNSADYDESYLNKLLKDKEVTETKLNKEEEKLVETKNQPTLNVDNHDVVKTNTSSFQKNEFNMSSYIFKFVGFFAILVAGLYFVMNFFRKGMLKKSGLGFFNSGKVIEVLNTTYIAPKRSMMVVRVNKQVFLVAQSEKGMDFLTEIKDTASFIKETEKEVIGSNFDTDLDVANSGSKEFKLKEIVGEVDDTVQFSNSAVVAKTANTSVKNEKESFSKQIKTKLKDLKQFQ